MRSGSSLVLLQFFIAVLIVAACAQYCREPPALINGAHTGGRQRYYRVGSVIRYYCRAGYRVQGWQYNVCCFDRRSPIPLWSRPEAPECITIDTPIIDCGPPDVPENGRVTALWGSVVGSFAFYRCLAGYERVGARMRTCELSGEWEPELPVCQLPRDIQCSPLGDPAFGSVVLTGRKVGSTATYSCISGYILDGPSLRVCQQDGQWSEEAPTCRRDVTCGGLPDPDNGVVTLSNNTPGSTAEYSCNPGYRLEGDSIRTCMENGEWSGAPPSCELDLACPSLTDPANGVVTFESIEVGSEATYSCNEGFTLNGEETRTCISDGQWSGDEPTCDPVECPPLSDPENGQVTVDSRVVGSQAIYSCNEGFVGGGTRTCQSDGQWSGDEPTCESIPPDECPPLNNPANGEVTFSEDTNIGSVATYSCDEGFMLNGEETRNCQSDGQWSGDEPTCDSVECPLLSNPENGLVTVDSRVVGSQAIYSCNEGFVGGGTRTCQSDGQWSGDEPTCEPVECPSLSDPDNGQVASDSTVFQSEATYSCNEGFTLNGEGLRTCQSDGQWSGDEPVCEPVECPLLSDPDNGEVAFDSTVFNSQATYSCNEGFTLNGDAIRTCQSDGQWSGNEPTCDPLCQDSVSARCDENGENCLYTASWTVRGDFISFEVTATTTGWVGIGFSDDQLMPDTDVVVGATDAQGSFVQDRFATARAEPPIDASQDIILTDVSVSNGDMTVQFTRPRDSGDSNDISLDQCRFLLFAFSGSFDISQNTIGYHGFENRLSSTERFCFPSAEFCPAPICPPLSNPINGQVNLTQGTVFGSQATYSCNEGFTPNGDATRTCQSDGQWSGNEPTCDPLCQDSVSARCDENGENCLFTASWMVRGDFISFEVTATTTGWVGIGFSDDQLMPDTDVVVGAADAQGSFVQDRFATARAEPPIDASQDIILTDVSVSNGDMIVQFTRPRDSGDSNDISLDQCRFLLFAFSGSFDISQNTIGYHGFENRLSSTERFCFPSAQFCPAPVCPSLSNPTNGQVALSQGTIFGSVATYSCNGGFILNGDETRTCQSNGNWSGQEPTCQSNPACQGMAAAACDQNGENCQYTATWTVEGDDISFEVRATTTGWVAIGFSEDQLMPNTDVVLGAANAEGSFIHDRFADARIPPPIDASQDISNTAVSVSNGEMVMQFTRPRDSGDSNDISLGQCRFLLFAFSGSFDINNPDSIGYHGFENRFASSEEVCFPDDSICPGNQFA